MAPRSSPAAASPPSSRGQVIVVQRTTHYLRTRIVGRFDLPTARALIDVLDAWSATRTHVTAFHDCSEVVDYDVDAREMLMTWSRAHQSGFDAVHVLVESRLIDLVLRIVAAIMAGKLVSHRTRMSFEAANARHLAR